MYKRIFLACLLCILLIFTAGCNEASQNTASAKETSKMTNTTVSMFSWHFELTNLAMSDEYIDLLEELSVTRVYQNVSEKVMKDSNIRYQVRNLASRGIETVALTGDKSWVIDGLDEYCSIVDSIDAYNQSVEKKYRMKRIALDVEIHVLPEWKTDKKAVFKKYINRMAEARDYAHERNLKVIQVIPTYYDNVSKTLFDKFLENCCDEITIMNYDKKQADRAIKYEVSTCSKKSIPVETIFETMPPSSTYGVTKNTTYYYGGMKALKKDAANLRKAYGTQLGIAYHQFTTVYRLVEGKRIGEVVLPETKNTAYDPGILLLYGDDGSVLEATPYWSKGRISSEGYRYLLNGAKKNVAYRVEYINMAEIKVLTEQANFEQEEGSKLVMFL